ncbi:MAG TPA: hydantoinase/oxoprolinase family protein [Burkholderiales bacterium]|nr:hydantoinase/oxoprolinase family protein [Burkholderiales bacterium]
MATEEHYRAGVDIGGTFTDIVLVSNSGTVYSKKLLSTPHDYSAAIESGLRELLSELSVRGAQIGEFVHATTVATNAIIERKGVRVALVTTRGFGDVLELGRFRAPRPYDMGFRKPEPLVPRRLRFEVPERVSSKGEVVEALDSAALESVAQALERENINALAICFINSYANDAHEAQAAAFFRRRLPAVSVTTSTSLMPQIGEYERTSSTVINAYIRPVVQSYVNALNARLEALEVAAPLMIMQSSGGIAPAPTVAERSLTIIESGPAAGVLGGQRLGEQIGIADLIVFDMGGTTAKATIIENHAFGMSPECEVGGGALMGNRMIKGAGYPVQAPTIDIAEVGAGGGSIAMVDEASGIKVGPRSAGADPGPVCYDHGGTQPTVTDANLALGYLNPAALVGGELALNADKARQAIRTLGARVGLDATETAYGIHAIANATMLRALRSVSSERGQDPAKFALLAIGGNGPVHAATLADSAGMNRIVVPPVAGLFSALGMLFADVEHHLAKGFYRRLTTGSADDINAAALSLVEGARKLLAEEGYAAAHQQRITVSLDMQYRAQSSTLTIPLSQYPATADTVATLFRSFEEEHRRTFGYVTGEIVQSVAIKATAQGLSATPRTPTRITHGNTRARRGEPARRAYFGEQHGWCDTPVIERADLDAQPRSGPLIVEEYDTTIIVRPGWTARLDRWNNVHLERA